MTDRTFTYENGGVKITAPNFDEAMTAGFLRKHRHEDPIEQMLALVEAALDEGNLAAFDELPLTSRTEGGPSMDDFYTAWQADSGITAGE